ncbi:uncharacterized protein LOC143261244 [Megalopta genalis]|uniref:uncharacterized protein LOC143261244 n=1 Tax=Megalopta genalis TaxID=115081 RepID=UPI003FD0FE7A
MTRLLNLLKLPPFWQKEKEEGRLSGESEKEIKEKFLDRLIFAVNQCDKEALNSVIRNGIDEGNVPYNCEELHEIALRWLESHEFGPITKGIMEKFLGDIKYNRSSYQEIVENIDEEIKFARSVVGREGISAFYQFLSFLIKGEGKICREVLKKERINLATMSSILHVTGANAAKAFKDLHILWFDEEGSKTQCLKTLEKEGINLTNISSILNVAGANAAKAFKGLYDLWFNEEGGKTQYLKTLEKEGIRLSNISSILHGARAKAPETFTNLYDLWFDKEGNKRLYIKTLENEKINLSNMSSILNGAGANAAEAFKDLYDSWFDARGNQTQRLKHFIEGEDEGSNFTLHNLSSILSREGGKAKGAFQELHSVCFNSKGQRTELLEDFYNAGFRPSNLSSILCGTGAHASFTLKQLHNISFNKKRKKTQLLKDFYNVGFRPCDLCGILSAAANSLKEFHDICFINETKEYLNRFLIEMKGFTPKNLSKILHGAATKICSALKDFHDICFDGNGNKTQLLNDFHKAGFMPCNLSNILSMTGDNATSILRNFHKSCFNKENCLNHFLAEKELFMPKDLSKILYAGGLGTCHTFEKLHDLCFDKVGNKTDYLNNLIKNNSPNAILNILYKKVKKIKKAPLLS